ncbi:TetR/AcrR family transcriptional regulator [Nonomuraea sp. NPDC002799]
MRADARRNRERIVTAALDLFTERGPGVSMDEIAQAAGLGVGTLYRHFPDRRALVDDLAAGTLTDLRAHLRARIGEPGPSWDVLLSVVRYCTGQPLALITSLAGSPPVPPSRAELVREIDELLAGIARRAQQEGSIRSDITPEQIVALLNVMVCRPGARFGDPLTTVMLDGLRTASA